MENIDLASFSFDYSEIVKGAAEIKKSIDQLKEDQKELVKNNKGSSEQYVQNAADLKNLNAVYREHINYISYTAKGTADQKIRAEALNVVLGKEATTIKELREQNKQLNKLRNETNITTEEGQAELKLLNDQLDANNALIKENVDQYTQQKINIGNYTSALSGLSPELSNVLSKFTATKEGVQKLADAIKAQIKVTKASQMSLFSISGALKVFRLALISTGIGAIVVALGSLITYLATTQAGIDAVTKVTRPLTAIFQTLLGIFQKLGGQLFEKPLESLTKIYDFVKKQLVESFTGLGKIIAGLFTFDMDKINEGADQIKNLADENAKMIKDGINGIGDQFTEAIRLGKELDQLEKELEQTRIDNTIALGEASERFKEQNKIAEDTNKTLAEREAAVRESIKAAEEINKLKQKELDLEIAILKNKQSRNDSTRADELEMAELIAKRNEMNAEELDRTRAQQKKLNSIRKEAQNTANAEAAKALDQRLKTEDEKIALFEQQQLDGRAKTLQQELDIERMISDMKLKQLDNQLKSQKISQEQYAREVLAIHQNLARAEAELAVDTAQREVEAYRRGFEEQMKERRFLSDAVVAEKTNELNKLLEKEIEFAQLRLEQGLINQQEYDDAIFELTEANRLAVAEINAEREEVEKAEAEELRALAFEAELERLLEEGATRFEIQQAQAEEQFEVRQEALNEQLSQGLISQEMYNARLEQLTRERANAEEKIEKAVADNKLDVTEKVLSQLSSIIGKESAAGKAIAIAQATMDTYKAAVAAYAAGSSIGGPAGVVMGPVSAGLAVAAGIANVKKIVSTKTPGGGSAGGSVPTASSMPEMRNFTGQGVNLGSANTNVQDRIEDQANQSNSAEQMTEAIREGAKQGTAQGSQEGITNLSANRQIMQGSEF